MESLTSHALAVRLSILKMANRSRGPHVGSCLSIVELLVYLFYKELTLKPGAPLWEERDRFILSKGHAAMAMYAILARRGMMDKHLLQGYMLDDGTLPAHLDRFSHDAIEVSAGALGHGLSIGVGMAQGFKLTGRKNRIFVLMGDGETEEGSVWEAAMSAPGLGLDNLTAIVDLNNLQGYGRPSELLQFYPVVEKWRAFGWQVVEADGHDFVSLARAFEFCKKADAPSIIIAKTIKGKGVSFMEDELKWHYYIVTDEILALAQEELELA